jgi:hypothetical protein
MKNLGAHEFAHVLGFGDMSKSDPCTNVTDPGFNLTYDEDNKVVGADPFVGPSKDELKLLGQYYNLIPIPEPGTLTILGFGFCALLRRYSGRS